jgi:virginiamycin A acetyltransferase
MPSLTGRAAVPLQPLPGDAVHGPAPTDPHPTAGFPRVGFLKPLVTGPNGVVGDDAYYGDPDGPEHFERKCVLYHFPFVGDKLVVGRFCAPARGVRFVMGGANHGPSGFSTYPFRIFGGGWEAITPGPGDLPDEGDTAVGNDVWVGYGALVMPGARIGAGAVVAARSVVTGGVPPYAVVGGTPARALRPRFPDGVVAELLAVRWWGWPAEKVTRHLRALVGAALDALRHAT